MAKNNDFFRDVGTEVFKPIGDFVGGAVTALQPGRVQQMQRRQRDIDLNKHFSILRGNFAPEVKEQAAQAILQSMDPKILEKMKAAGASVYQQRGATTDPMTQAAVDLGKIHKARGEFGSIEKPIAPETAAFFDAAEKSVKDKVGFKEPVINPKTGKPRKVFAGPPGSPEVSGTRNVDGTVTMPKGKVVDNRGLFSEGASPFGPAIGDVTSYDVDTKKPRTVATGKGVMPLEDYFQAGTETVPEENIPRTFEQLGIANTEDQATLQEMQDALPDRDLRLEYQDDPEGMQRLMKLWREGKLTKQNLRKAFSVIQSKARKSLGLA